MGKLVDEGIVGKGKGSIMEDALAYGTIGYEKEGVVIQYEAASLKMAQKFLAVQSDDVVKSEAAFWAKLLDKEIAEHSKKH